MNHPLPPTSPSPRILIPFLLTSSEYVYCERSVKASATPSLPPNSNASAPSKLLPRLQSRLLGHPPRLTAVERKQFTFHSVISLKEGRSLPRTTTSSAVSLFIPCRFSKVRYFGSVLSLHGLVEAFHFFLLTSTKVRCKWSIEAHLRS